MGVRKLDPKTKAAARYAGNKSWQSLAGKPVAAPIKWAERPGALTGPIQATNKFVNLSGIS